MTNTLHVLVTITMFSKYETPSFGKLDKKSININGIKDFNCSPIDNIVAYWVAQDKDSRLTLLGLTNRNEIRKKICSTCATTCAIKSTDIPKWGKKRMKRNTLESTLTSKFSYVW